MSQTLQQVAELGGQYQERNQEQKHGEKVGFREHLPGRGIGDEKVNVKEGHGHRAGQDHPPFEQAQKTGRPRAETPPESPQPGHGCLPLGYRRRKAGPGVKEAEEVVLQGHEDHAEYDEMHQDEDRRTTDGGPVRR